MLIVGLTGGIGSGKSTVAHLFAERGAPIIDADMIAHELTRPTELTFKEIILHFGTAILHPNGTLNRPMLRNIIFKSPAERAWLENLLHPRIRERIQLSITQLNAPYCIVVIPLLFETGRYPFLHRVLVVNAARETQIARVIDRDKTDNAKVDSILNAQVSQQQRLDKADDIINNDGTLAELIPQVEKLHQFYSTQVVQ